MYLATSLHQQLAIHAVNELSQHETSLTVMSILLKTQYKCCVIQDLTKYMRPFICVVIYTEIAKHQGR